MQAQADACAQPAIGSDPNDQTQLITLCRTRWKLSRMPFLLGIRNPESSFGHLACSPIRGRSSGVSDSAKGRNSRREVWRANEVIIAYSARANAIPASTPPKHSKLFEKKFVAIISHWPCSKYAMVSNAKLEKVVNAPQKPTTTRSRQ